MKYTIFETFVGAGGSYLGFKKNNFISKYVNDIDQDCIKTLTYNNPELILDNAYIDNKDILHVDGKNILNKINMKPLELDVLIGGIVCKGFSLAGEKSPNDKRNFYFLKQFDLIRDLRPKISILENVPSILNAKILNLNTPKKLREEVDYIWKELAIFKGKKAKFRKQNYIPPEFEEYGKKIRFKKNELIKKLESGNYLINVFDFIKELYKNLGYKVYYSVLNSAWYGSATKRERVIIVGIRIDIKIPFTFPKPTHMSEELKNKYLKNLLKNIDENKFKKPVTVFEALKKIDYKKIDNDNVAMNHNAKTIERFKYIEQGKSIVEVLDRLPKELIISKFYSRGNTMRLNGNMPAPTLVPGHSNFPIHPIYNRSITVREAACITGFPINYKFFGNHSKRCEQVGNAIPPNLSIALAKSCKNLLDLYYSQVNKMINFDTKNFDEEILNKSLKLYIDIFK